MALTTMRGMGVVTGVEMEVVEEMEVEAAVAKHNQGLLSGWCSAALPKHLSDRSCSGGVCGCSWSVCPCQVGRTHNVLYMYQHMMYHICMCAQQGMQGPDAAVVQQCVRGAPAAMFVETGLQEGAGWCPADVAGFCSDSLSTWSCACWTG
jgi:hypothetical protein